MTPESQRIAIAEACGYRCEPLPDVLTFWTPDGGRVYLAGLPDYLSDLNAMHEAEKVLHKDVSQYLDYAQHLQTICGGIIDALFATSAQRAEAFLRTLNLWTP